MISEKKLIAWLNKEIGHQKFQHHGGRKDSIDKGWWKGATWAFRRVKDRARCYPGLKADDEVLRAADLLAEAVRDRYGWKIICRSARNYIKARGLK